MWLCEREYNADLNLPRVLGEVSPAPAAPVFQRGGHAESGPAADRYAGLLCPAGSNLLSYRGERLLLLSEGVNLKESLNHTCWQQKQDVTALLEEGTLAPGCAFLFPEAGVLAEELPVLPTVILDSFPRSYPGLPLAGLYHVAANALSVWGGALDPLCEDLESYRQRDWTIWLLAGTERGALALTEDLNRRQICKIRQKYYNR